MGLYQEENSNYADIIRIVNGKLAKKVSPETPGAVKRLYTVAKTGEEKETHELHYPAIEGMLVSGQVKELTFGQVMELTFENNGERAIVSLPFPGALAESIIQRLVNVDLSKPVRLNAGADKDTGKNFTWITQGGAKVVASYTKDNLGDCPPMIKKVVAGKTKWDSDDRTAFLYDKFVELFNQPKGEKAPDAPAKVVESPPDDDVPF